MNHRAERLSKTRAQDDSLISRYVASFGKLADLCDFEFMDPAIGLLATGTKNEFGGTHWRPIRFDTVPSALEPLYAKLPAPFPALYEQLVLSHRWAEVDLETYTLLANPPGSDLGGLLGNVLKDRGLREALLPAGFIQFGKGPDIDYDPVCFDISARRKPRDYGVVKIDHEEILCNDRVKVVAVLAPSFKELMLQTIELANRKATQNPQTRPSTRL